jgi:hypothetical protein
MLKNLYNTWFLSNNCPSTLSSIHVKNVPVQYEHRVYTTNYYEEEYKKNSTKKGHSNNKHKEPVHKSSISQAQELQKYYDNMKSIGEYQELSRKPHTVKKYQDSTTHDNSSRGGHSQYKFNTKHRRASTETRKMDEYNSDMEEETIKHSNESKDKRGDKEKKIRGKYMDMNEAHYNMGHLGETALRSILNRNGIKATGTFKNFISCMKWKGGNKRVSKVDVNPP